MGIEMFENKWEERLYDILYHPRWHSLVELQRFGGIDLPLIKMRKQSVYIYGCGKYVSAFILYMHEYGIQVKGIIDQDIEKTKIKRYDDIPIFHITELDKITDKSNAIAIIGVHDLYGTELEEVVGILRQGGVEHFCTVRPGERTVIDACLYDRGYRIDYYQSHYEQICNLLKLVDDDDSKENILEFVRTFMQGRTYLRFQGSGRHKYFFDTMENGDPIELYTHKDDEVWLNCGANIGDNIFLYFANELDADTIFAVEGDTPLYKELCRNIKRLPLNYREKVIPVNEFISEDTDFEKLLQGKKVSLLNADIEGNELDLLNACANIITRDRPVVAICVYHKPGDLFEIAEFLNDIVDDYIYVMRKYITGGRYDFQQRWEMVLYAIPKERISR